MFEDKFPVVLNEYKNLKLYARYNTSVNMGYPETGDGTQFNTLQFGVTKGSAVTLTGRAYMPNNDKVALQVITVDNKYGYIWNEIFKDFTTENINAGNPDWEKVFYELSANHQSILENNLFCARIIQLADKQGIAVPKKHRQELYNLQYRLMQRDNKIKTSEYVSSVQEGTSVNFSLYYDALIKFMDNPGLGLVISGTVAIVIAIVLVAGTFAAAYALFKTLNAESIVDYQYSAELTADLIKLLPPNVYKKLMDENEANAKLANKAIDKASGKSTMKTLTYVVAGFAGFYLIDKFLSTRSNK